MHLNNLMLASDGDSLVWGAGVQDLPGAFQLPSPLLHPSLRLLRVCLKALCAQGRGVGVGLRVVPDIYISSGLWSLQSTGLPAVHVGWTW